MVNIPLTLVAAVVVAFVVSYLSIPIFNKFMRATGIVGSDMMKADKRIIADMGGSGVMTGFVLGVFLFIALEILIPPRLPGLIYILASLNTILIITLIGVFDVLTTLMKQREGMGMFEKLKRKGIPPWMYFLIPLPAAVPLVAVNAGISSMTLPFIGRVDLGIIYPMVLIPIGVLCCTNATNFLAGFNGLEAGMGTVLHVSLGLYALNAGKIDAALLSLVFAASLVAFLRYNWYPAQVFPGDLNYTIGTVAVCVTVLGNMEKFAVICFFPYIVEALLKALSGFKAENYGVLKPDGTVKPTESKIRSLTHLIMRVGSFKEWQVSLILIIVEIIFCLIAFLITPLI